MICSRMARNARTFEYVPERANRGVGASIPRERRQITIQRIEHGAQCQPRDARPLRHLHDGVTNLARRDWLILVEQRFYEDG